MWSGEHGDEGVFEGAHLRATRLLNSPQSIRRPRVPIMIGGGGEQKTLRLVAQYGDACNVFGTADKLRHKYRVLEEHCRRLGRPFEEIERTTLQTFRAHENEQGPQESANQALDRFAELADAGARTIIFNIRDVWRPGVMDVVGRDLIPGLKAL